MSRFFSFTQMLRGTTLLALLSFSLLHAHLSPFAVAILMMSLLSSLFMDLFQRPHLVTLGLFVALSVSSFGFSRAVFVDRTALDLGLLLVTVLTILCAGLLAWLLSQMFGGDYGK